MKNFADLFTRLDQTNSTLKKVAALVAYFEKVDDVDRLWAMGLLSHRKPKRTVKTSLLREWAAEIANVPLWLFEDSYRVVGDLAETIALVLPPPTKETDHSLTHWIEEIKSLAKLTDEEKKERILESWSGLKRDERFLYNKLITGGFRVGVSQKLMMRALSQYSGQEESAIAHRLMGNWTPDNTTYTDLILAENPLDDISKPYPFYLAYAVDDSPEKLGAPSEWQIERKWDGIRGQIIVREDKLFVWSRGEELVTDKFPEYHPLAELLPNGTVLDGEILPFADGKPLSFNVLQTRIGRKNITKKILESAPISLMVYDILEFEGKDIRKKTMEERRKILEDLIIGLPANNIIMLSETLEFATWEAAAAERENSRLHLSEGFMLKRKNAEYKIGRKKGDWWKWKVEPLTIDAVMIYAQQGSGRRANLYTDYTFAVWDNEKLVPFTKAYSGLTDAEFRQITSWVRKNTLERFGPVRSVKPTHVFEIAFEGINKSTRHKSGVALRFPRMLRWRKDKPVKEANTLEDLKGMLAVYG